MISKLMASILVSNLLVLLVLQNGLAWADDGNGMSRIDSILAEHYQENQIKPLTKCSDLQFLRRASLDLIGRTPTLVEIRKFEEAPDRAQLIGTLIDSTEFDRFLSEIWTAWLIGYSNEFGTDREVFRIWLEEQIRNQIGFNQIVSNLITANGSVAMNGPANFLVRHRELPAIQVCRSFLGVRLECAQCHDHPFDRWTEDDYQKMNRFFNSTRISEENGAARVREVITEIDREDRPRFLTGSVPKTSKLRSELALYVTNCKPFARTFANRVWYQLIGRGIIDPPDDHNQENSPSVKPLLIYLAEQASESEFQIKPFFKAVCLTDAYQRRCATHEHGDTLRNSFAARQIKPLLPEQYVDSFRSITGSQMDRQRRRQIINRLVGESQVNEDFQRSWDYRETNQQLMERLATDLNPIGTKSVGLDELFLTVLTRPPTPRERELCRNKGNTDVLFALLFGNEFFFSH